MEKSIEEIMKDDKLTHSITLKGDSRDPIIISVDTVLNYENMNKDTLYIKDNKGYVNKGSHIVVREIKDGN